MIKYRIWGDAIVVVVADVTTTDIHRDDTQGYTVQYISTPEARAEKCEDDDLLNERPSFPRVRNERARGQIQGKSRRARLCSSAIPMQPY